MVSKKVFITWNEFHRDTQFLSWALPDKKWKGIIGVARGGLVPASILARSLNIRLVETVCISSYDDKTNTQLPAKVLKHISKEDEGEGWLVVDDLVDQGTTAKIVKEMLPKAHYAAVYAKKKGKTFVDSYASEINAWIVFPWEEDAPERLFSYASG